jgi:hypothetical protein
VIGIGVRLLRSRQLTQGKIDGLVFSLMQNVELDRVTRRKTADGTGELAGVVDRLAIYRGNDIAGWRPCSESKPSAGELSQQSQERLFGAGFQFFGIQGAVLVWICRIEAFSTTARYSSAVKIHRLVRG